MALAKLTDKEGTQQDQKPSGTGPTEEQVDMQATIGQHIDKNSTKVEDEAGTGQIDSPGG
jgi:hypothetical protein